MKIKKSFTNIYLKEDTEVTEPITIDQSVAELADDIQDQAEFVDTPITNQQAAQVAQEIKQAAPAISADDVVVMPEDDDDIL